MRADRGQNIGLSFKSTVARLDELTGALAALGSARSERLTMSSPHTVLHASLVLGAALLPSIAQAAEADEALIIVTGHRDPAHHRVERTAGGVDIVDATDFSDRLAVSLRDTLSFSPGVYLQPRFGQEVRISIRGSGLSRGYHMRGLTLLQDGVPINLADDNGDFQELDPQVFEHIEVYRGANALRFGGTTLGGAINAVTPIGRSASGLVARADGGSFSTFRGKVAVGSAGPVADFFMALTGDTSDGDREHARRRSLRFNSNVGLKISEKVETRFYASGNYVRQDLPGPLTRSQALSTPGVSLQPNIIADQERDTDSIRVQNQTTVHLSHGDVAFGAFLNAKQLFHPIFQVIDQKSIDRGAFVRVNVRTSVGSLPTELTAGVTARFGDVAARNFLNIAGRRGRLISDADQTARTINGYGELRLMPAEHLTLIAGGVAVEGRRKVVNNSNPSRSGTASYSTFSPRLGFLLKPTRNIQLFGNISRSVELPGFNELNQTPFPVDGAVQPGFVDLAAQRAWTFEIGTRGRAGIAAFDLSLYRAAIRGELLQFDQGSGVPAATANAERTVHQGIEAGLDLQLAPWALLRQVYTYSDFRFRNDLNYGDNRLPVIPKHAYRAELRVGQDALHVTPSLEWVPHGAWADYRNTTRAPGYVLLAATAEARVREGMSVFLDVRNITGKRAIGDISAVVAGSSNSVIYFPTERRAIYGGLRASF